MKRQSIAWWSSIVSKCLILAGNNLRAYASTLPWSDGNKLCGIGCKTFWHMPNCFLAWQNIDRLETNGVLNIAIYFKTYKMFPYFAKQWFAWNTSSAKHCYIKNLRNVSLLCKTLISWEQVACSAQWKPQETSGTRGLCHRARERTGPSGIGSGKPAQKQALIFQPQSFRIFDLRKFYRLRIPCKLG